MNALNELSLSSYANAFDRGLPLEVVRQRAPAVFATSAHESLSEKYSFIPTVDVLKGLMHAGFLPVEARQTRTRRASPLHARHIIRLRPRFQTVTLRDSVAEIVLLNSHDGSSTYWLRLGLMRVVCLNGLLTSRGAFPAYCVSHRGNVVDEVITGALKLSEEFENLAARVEQMERRQMFKDEQIRFAEKAVALRYPDPAQRGMEASQLLTCRRPEDLGEDLWTTLNKTEEWLLRGGLSRRSASGRLTRTRRITSLKEDIRLHSALWALAEEVLAA